MANLPEPISREDKLLHNIADKTPNIDDLVPISREEEYLKYIAMNGTAGGSGSGESVKIVQETGTSTTSVMSQNAVSEEFKKLGTASSCDTGTSEGNVPIINSGGKLDNSVIPSLTITHIFVAKSEDEMLNRQGVEKGDVCVRTDESKTYILQTQPTEDGKSATKTSLSDWIELLAPTDEVSSVNGKKGNVVVTAADVGTYTKSQIDSKMPAIVQTTGTLTDFVMSQNAVTNELGLKVDKIEGKGLSTEDFTRDNKEKLDKAVVNTATGEDAIAIGNFSNAAGMGNIAIGAAASASEDYSIAIGQQSSATKEQNIAIGASSKSNGSSSIAIGNSAFAEDKGTTTNIVNGSVAIGNYAHSLYPENVVIGNGAEVTGKNSVAVGYNATAKDDYVFSVGDDNKTRRIVNVTDPQNAQDAATKKYVDDKVAESGGGSNINVVQTTGTSETDVMSQKSVTDILATKVDAVEGKGLSTADFTTEEKTKLANIPDKIPEITIVQAAGTSETDVMSQKAVTSGLDGKVDKIDGKGLSTEDFTTEDKGKLDKTVVNYSTNQSGLAIGENLSIAGSNATAIGDNSVALGISAEATGENSVALGGNSVAYEKNIVSVGNGSNSQNPETRRIVNVTDPQNSQDAATKNYVDTRINPTILYSNDSGTTETITLSQPYTDFSRIGVYALGQYDVAMDSTYGEIYTSLEYMTLACVSGEKDADGAYNCTVWRTAKIKFSENTITFVTNCASSFVKGDVGYKIGTDDGLKITRVVGYK